MTPVIPSAVHPATAAPNSGALRSFPGRSRPGTGPDCGTPKPEISGRKGGRGSEWTVANQRLTQIVRTPSSGFALWNFPLQHRCNDTCNTAATALQQSGNRCTRLHQVAVSCTRLRLKFFAGPRLSAIASRRRRVLDPESIFPPSSRLKTQDSHSPRIFGLIWCCLVLFGPKIFLVL